MFLIVLSTSLWSVFSNTWKVYESNPDTDIYYTWMYRKTHALTDAQLILSGIESKPRFSDTGAFWIGPWSAGSDRPFYRPLPCTIWWIMFHNLGDRSLATWLAVLAVSHLLFSLLLWAFLGDLFGSVIVGTTIVVLWLLGTAEWLFGFSSMRYALASWVDHIEVWVAMAIIGSLWCFLRYLRTSVRTWMYGACVAFLLGTTIKEMIYITPLLALLLLWHQGQTRRWRAILPIGGLALLAICYRQWALRGLPAFSPRNGSWWPRMFTETISGSPGVTLLHGDGLPLMIGCIGIAAICCATRKSWYWGALWSALAAGCALMAMRRGAEFEDPVFYALLGSSLAWKMGFTVMLLALLLWHILSSRQNNSRFGWAWVVLSYLLLLHAPNSAHIFYVPSIGWAIVLGFALRDIARTTNLERLNPHFVDSPAGSERNANQ